MTRRCVPCSGEAVTNHTRRQLRRLSEIHFEHGEGGSPWVADEVGQQAQVGSLRVEVIVEGPAGKQRDQVN